MPCLSSDQAAIITNCTANLTAAMSVPVQYFHFNQKTFESSRCMLSSMAAWNSSAGHNRTGAVIVSAVQNLVINASSLTDDQKANAAKYFRNCLSNTPWGTFDGMFRRNPGRSVSFLYIGTASFPDSLYSYYKGLQVSIATQ